MILSRNPTHEPWYNLALEEVLTKESEEDIFMLWRNRSAIIVGRNQNTHAEIDLDYVRENGIDVARRMTGGGAVYHDLGNINYSCITRAGENRFASFETFALPVIRALSKMGVTAGFSGRNDLLVEGRKISGSAKSFIGGRVLFHGTLLFDTDLSVLGKALTPDPTKIAGKGITSIRSRVANLKEYLPAWTPEEFMQKLEIELLSDFSLSHAVPVAERYRESAELLATKKYRTWAWNFGASPAYDVQRTARFAGGSVTAAMRVEAGCLRDVSFTGDFFGEKPVAELSAALEGVPYRRDAILQVFSQIGCDAYLLGVTEAELASLFD